MTMNLPAHGPTTGILQAALHLLMKKHNVKAKQGLGLDYNAEQLEQLKLAQNVYLILIIELLSQRGQVSHHSQHEQKS